MPRIPAFPLVGTALLVALTGCAALPRFGAPAASGTPTPTPPRHAFETVAAAAGAIERSTTYEATFSYRRKNGRRVTKMTGRVKFSAKPKPAWEYHVDDMVAGGVNQPGGMRARVFDKTAYVHMGKLASLTAGTPWVKLVPPESVGGMAPALEYFLFQVQGVDPPGHTRMLTASVDVRPVGPEQLDGVRTTRYKGTYEALSAALRVPDPMYESMYNNIGGKRNVNFAVWLDERRLPRKIVLRSEKSTSPYNKVTDVALNLRFDAIGEPVRIRRPAADATMSVRELNRRLRRLAS